MSKADAVQSDSEAEVVQTASGREIRKPYREGCFDYAVGFAAAFFMTAVIWGYGIVLLHPSNNPFLHGASVTLFVVLSLIGFGAVAAAYTAPVRFFELMEDDPSASMADGGEDQ